MIKQPQKLTNFNSPLIGSNPSQLTDVNGVIYFTADDGKQGRELWKLDERGNPRLVGDINRGFDSSNPDNLIAINGTLYFTADGGKEGRELWKISETGVPEQVDDINNGKNSSNPSDLTVFNNTLYFIADDERYGRELFKLDNLGNPRIVKDISSSYKSSNPTNLTIFNDSLFFTLTDRDGRIELWRENKTGEIEQVQGISSSYSYNFSNLTIFNNSLYFSTTDDNNRTYLWKTNDVGDVERVNTTSSSDFYNPSNFTIVNDTLYFTTTDKYDNRIYFWKTNNSNINSREEIERVQGINTNSYKTSNFTTVNNTLYFTITDFNGVQLWKINEDGDGERIRNIQSNSSELSNFTIFNNTLYFTVASRDNRLDIYKIDEQGFGERVRGTNSRYSNLSNFTVVNEKLYYIANDSELWQIDETVFARRVSGLNSFLSNISDLTVANNSIYFSVTEKNRNNDAKLWTLDERGNAQKVRDIDEMSNPSNISVINDTLYFTASNRNYGNELWKVDKVNKYSRAIRLSQINRETREAPSDFINVDGTLYFTAEDRNLGRRLWRIDSNGNPEPISTPSNIEDLTVLKDTLYFTYQSGSEGRKLLKVTNDESRVARTVGNSSNLWNPENLTVFDDKLYFTVTGSKGEKELVRLDGKGNVEPIRFLGSSSRYPSSNPRNLIAVNDTLYLIAGEEDSGRLWKINERDEAEYVRDNNSSYPALNPENIYFVNDNLYFTAENPRHGIGIWTLDERGYSKHIGDIQYRKLFSNLDNFTVFQDTLFLTTSHEQGAHLWVINNRNREREPRLELIRNTLSFQDIDSLTVVKDTLYFTGDDGRYGNELWKFDERGNVKLVKDINTSTYASSNPENLTVVGDYLYFTATNQSETKLWWVDSEGKLNEVNSINSRLTNFSNFTVVNGDFYLTVTDTNSRELWKISGNNAKRVAEINRGSGFSEDFNLSYIDGKLYFVSDINSSSPQIQVIENQAPEIRLSSSRVTFNEGYREGYGKPISISRSPYVRDMDSDDFRNGELRVRITDGGHPDDRLGVGQFGFIKLDGNILKHRDEEIGVLTPSYGTEEMVVKFTTHVTREIVRNLLGLITYTNFSHNPSETPRTVEFVLTDGDGGTSKVATKTINVRGRNDAPILGKEEIIYDSNSNLDPTKSDSSSNIRSNFDYRPYGNGKANKTLVDGGIQLTSDNEAYAGLSTTSIPKLYSKSGYTLSFNAQVLSEDHSSFGDNDKNNDGKVDRAGFNVTLLGSDRQGIELGFWENRIWVKQDEFSNQGSGYVDGTSPFSTLFTQVEGIDFDTTKSVDYDLAIYGFTYTLFANNKSILSGRLRNYSKYRPTTDPERRLPNPYGKSNYIFFGDNSPYAGADVKLGDISISTTPTSSFTPSNEIITYKENEPGVIIAPNIKVTDYDSPNFDKGKLTVSFDSMTQDGDVLGINTQNNSPIRVSGNSILFNGSFIGVIENSFKENSLEIIFTSKATLEVVETLMRNITYANNYDGLRGGSRRIKFALDDGDGGGNIIRKEIKVESVNDAPVVANPIKTITTNEEAKFSFTIPENTFQDADGNSLTLNATLEDGSPLPTWLKFDSETATFSGTPQEENVGFIRVKVTAKDNAGESVQNSFILRVANVNKVPIVNPNQTFTIDENSRIFTSVGKVQGRDDDGDFLLEWKITDGNLDLDNDGKAAFSINYITGEIKVNDSDDLDFESNPSFELKVTASDRIDTSIPTTVNVNLNDIKGKQINGTSSSDRRLYGGLEGDYIDGKERNDYLYGRGGNDTLKGGTGNDNLYGGEGDDSIDGGAGFDILRESADVNFILTNSQLKGNGTDSFVNIERAILSGGNSNNIIDASAYSGSTYLYGRGGNDTLKGGTRNDYLYGGQGDDSIDGGRGYDIIRESRDVDFTLTDTQLIGNGRDTLASIERVILTGGNSNNTINASGFTGSTYLYGRSGNDTLNGGTGNDYIYGGRGSDVINGGLGNDNLYGEEGDDWINGGEGFDTVRDRGDVNFTLNNNQLIGRGTDTLISIERAILSGGNSANNIDASSFIGSVYLYAASGNDTLLGASGNDFLRGDGGDDFIDGAAGNDRVYGGSGKDIFVLSASMGKDTIYDFEDGVDSLGLSNSLTFNDLDIQGNGNNTDILFGNRVLATLRGIDSSLIEESDFIAV